MAVVVTSPVSRAARLHDMRTALMDGEYFMQMQEKLLYREVCAYVCYLLHLELLKKDEDRQE